MSTWYRRYWYAWITIHYSKTVFSRAIMGPYLTEEAAKYAAHRRIGHGKNLNSELNYDIIVSQNMPWY